MSSIIGLQGKAGFSEYAASKAGIIAFTKSLAMELGRKGINVNCVSPGIVQRGEITLEILDKLAKTNYSCSYGKPEDIANTVTFFNHRRSIIHYWAEYHRRWGKEPWIKRRLIIE